MKYDEESWVTVVVIGIAFGLLCAVIYNSVHGWTP